MEDTYQTLKKIYGMSKNIDLQKVNYTVFDIETTGLTYQDEITVVAYITSSFNHDEGENTVIKVIGQNPRTTDFETEQENLIQNKFTEDVTEFEVEFTMVNSEKDLIEEFTNNLDKLPYDTVLSAYNGAMYNGRGFDVSHFRTRCLANNIEPPFSGRAYVDAKEAAVDNGAFNLNQIMVPSVSSLSRSDWDEFARYLGHDDSSEFSRKGDVHSWVDEKEPDADDIREFSELHDVDVPIKTDGSLNGVFDQMAEIDLEEVPNLSFAPEIDGEEVAKKGQEGDLESVGLHCISDVIKTQYVLEKVLKYGCKHNLRLSIQ